PHAAKRLHARTSGGSPMARVQRNRNPLWLSRGWTAWRQLVRSTGSRGAQKQLPSVRQGKVPAVGSTRPVLRLVAIDNDFGSGLQGILGESTPEQDIRRPRFDCPVYKRAIGLLHLDVQPRVGI